VPIYEFRCGNCDSIVEKLCPAGTRESDIPCPSCGKNELARKFSTFGFKSGSSGRDIDYSPPPSSGGSGCGSCVSHNCASCH
jgi:putative FmdB family regulatory protein